MDNCIIEATFFDGTVKEYDMKTLYSIFSQFKVFDKNEELFKKVQVDVGGYGIAWNDELDLDAEDIWENGKEVSVNTSVDANLFLAQQLSEARDSVNMTQKQLSEKVGIYQADISKIERGIGNPSLLTLQRLADGLDMTLKIEFVPKNTMK